MFRITFFTIFFFSFFLGFSQDTTSFKSLEDIHKQYIFKGKYSVLNKADSIFNNYIKGLSYKELNYENAMLYNISIDFVSDSKKVFDSIASIKENPLNASKKWNTFSRLQEYKTVLLENEQPYEPYTLDSIYVESLEPNIKALYFWNLSEVYYHCKAYNKGIATANKVVALLQDEGYEPAEVFRLLGGLYYNLGKREKGMEIMNVAYDIALQDTSIESNLVTSLAWNLGVFNYQNSQYSEALPFLKESIKHYEIARGNTPYLISRYALLADSYYYLWDLKNAELAALKAQSLADDVIKTNDPYLKGLVASTLSKIWGYQEKYSEAKAILKPALAKTIEAFGEDSSLAAAFTSDMANLEWEAGNYEEAEQYYLQAVSRAEKTDRIYTKTAALSDINNFYINTNQYNKATKYVEREKELLRENLDTTSIIYNANRYKEAYIAAKLTDYTTARMLLEKRTTDLNRYTAIEDEIILTTGLSLDIDYDEYMKTKDTLLLNNAYRKLNPFLKLIIKQKSSLNYDSSKMFYGDVVSEQIEPAIRILHESIKIKPSQEKYTLLLRFMEINKSSSLLDGLQNTTLAATYDVDQELISTKTVLIDSLQKIDASINTFTEDSASNDSLQSSYLDTQLRLQEQIDSLDFIVKEKFPTYYSASTLTLAEKIPYYQDYLIDKNEAVIEYYVSDTYIYRLFVEKDAISLEEISGVSAIESEVNALQSDLKNRKEISNSALRLSEKLLPKFSKTTTKLIIITDDFLTKIPFEVLQHQDNYLIENFAISYAGSLQLLNEQTKKSNKSKKNWLGVAPAYKNQALSNNYNEVENIIRKVKGDSLIGKNATKQKFKSQASKYGILHLATHGNLDHVNPMNNSLLFEDTEGDNELSLQEIYGMNLDAQLAVLSACNSGSGKYQKGDGVMSISRAFNYAGVSSTLVSLWKIPDVETSKIMSSFYTYLKDGNPKDVALQKAKIDYLNTTEDEALKHPYYWAGFVLTGDTSPVYNSSWETWLLAFIGLLLIVAYFYFRGKKKK